MAGKRRRIRKKLVCINCHLRKIKCNKQQPCSNCVRLKISSSCRYDKDCTSSDEHSNKEHTVSDTPDQPTKTVSKHVSSGSSSPILLGRRLSFSDSVMPIYSHTENEDYGRSQTAIPPVVSNPSTKNMHATVERSKPVFIDKNFQIGLNHFLSILSYNPIPISNFDFNLLAVFQHDPSGKGMIMLNAYHVLPLITPFHSNSPTRLVMTCIRRSSSNGIDLFRDMLDNVVKELEEFAARYFAKRYLVPFEPSLGRNITDIKSVVSELGSKIGIHFLPHFTKSDIKYEIISVLPPMEVIYCLTNIFLRHLHKLIPIVEESTFKTDIYRLFKCDRAEAHQGRVRDIIIESNKDLCTLSILLIALRTTYVFVVKEIHEEGTLRFLNHEEKVLIRSNPIPIESHHISLKCLKLYEMGFCHSFSQLILMIFLYYYQGICPEGPLHNQGQLSSIGILFSNIVNTAAFLNLNRASERACGWWTELQSDNLPIFRKKVLWHILLIMDFEHSIVFNKGLSIKMDCYDNKFEGYDYFGDHTEEERDFLKGIDQVLPIIQRARRLIDNAFIVSKKVKISYLLGSLSELENIVKDKLGIFKDYLCPIDEQKTFSKMIKFRVYLHFKILSIIIYQAIVHFFQGEEKLELSIYYFQKLFCICNYELVGLSYNFLKNCEKFFGAFADIILRSPIVNFYRARAGSILIGVTLQSIQLHLKSLPAKDETEYHASLKKLVPLISQKLTLFQNSYLKMLLNLGKRTLSGWNYLKGILIGFKIAFNEESYSSNLNEAKNCIIWYSIEGWKELNKTMGICCDELHWMEDFYKNIYDSEDEETFDCFNFTSDQLSATEIVKQSQLDRFWKYVEIFNEEGTKLIFSRDTFMLFDVNKNENHFELDLNFNLDTDFLNNFSLEEIESLSNDLHVLS